MSGIGIGARAAVGLMLASGTSQIALAQVIAQPPQAQGETQTSAVETAEDAEIVVTGLRASIADAIDTKRTATNIVDSISAQDIGKLPDQNVVDTLARVPGVQISRSRGDGQSFTIRGISQNVTLLNGRPFPLGLDAVASDIVASVDVIKSPSADMIEGALGGTVNLKTKRPLNLPQATIAVRGAVQFAEVIDDVGFRGSALFSQKLFDGDVGVLVNVAYQDIRSEQQEFESQGYTRVSNIDATGDGVADLNLFRINRLTHSALPQRKERLTANAALQIQPTSNLDLLFEATYTKFDSQAYPERLQILYEGSSTTTGAQADADGTITSGRFNNINYRPLVYQEDDESDSLSFGARADWNVGGWKIGLDGAYSKGKAPRNGGTFTFVLRQRTGTASTTFDLLAPESPNFTPSATYNLGDPASYRVDSLSDAMNEIDRDATAIRLDVERELGWGLLKSLTVGYRYEDRFEYSAQRRGPTALAALRTVFDANGDGIIALSETPYTPGPSSIFFPGVEGDFPRVWLGGRIDADAAREQLGYDRPPVQPETVSEVGEKKHAIYAKLDLDGEIFGLPLRGNVGGRYLTIDRTVDGVSLAGTTLLPVRVESKFNRFLPSATLVAELDPDILLRLSAARVVATPSLGQLRSGFTFSVINNQGSGGNPLLKPFEADQADLSVEWYFGEANLLAGALFYKKVNSFTITQQVETPAPEGYANPNNAPLPLLITRPVNGTDGTIKGLEVNYQHAFTFLPEPLDGFGIQASYTYADSKSPNSAGTGTQPLPNLSKNSFSLTGYYDKGRIEGRLAYTYRDEALLSEGLVSAGGNLFAAANDTLDGSLQFDLTEQVRLTLDVQNILKSKVTLYNDNPGRINRLTIDDRRWYLGFSAVF